MLPILSYQALCQLGVAGVRFVRNKSGDAIIDRSYNLVHLLGAYGTRIQAITRCSTASRSGSMLLSLPFERHSYEIVVKCRVYATAMDAFHALKSSLVHFEQDKLRSKRHWLDTGWSDMTG